MNWSKSAIVWGVVVVVLCLGFVSVSEGKTVFFEDHFEQNIVGKTPKGWSIGSYGGASLEVTDQVFYPGVHDPYKGKSVKFSDLGNGAAAYLSFSTSNPPPKTMKIIILTAFMRSEQADGQGYPFVIQDCAIRAGFDMNGKFFYSTAGENNKEKWVHLDAYKAEQWYEFKVVADLETQKYDFYIDKVKKAEGIPFVKPIDRISSFWLGSGGKGAGTYYVDDVKVEVEKGDAPSGSLVMKEKKERAGKAGKIGTAVVNSFGDVISYGHVKSRLRDHFPIGVHMGGPTRFRYPPVSWVWEKDVLGAGDTTPGALRADGWHPYPDMTLAVALKGNYEIWFSLRKARGFICGIDAKLSGEKKLATVKLGKKDIPPGVDTHCRFFWKKWKTADLTGKDLILNHPMGLQTVVDGIKFVPVRADLGDHREIVILRDFLDRLSPRDRIYEWTNPEHAKPCLDLVFTRLKKLNLDTVVFNIAGTNIRFVEAVVQKADEHGLRVIPEVGYFYNAAGSKTKATEEQIERVFGKLVERVKDYPSMLAYMTAHEPHIEETHKMAVTHRVLKRLDPKHPSIAYYARSGELGGAARPKDNMKILCERAGAEVLLHDLYPIRHAESDFLKNFDPFIRCLDDAYRQAGGRPLWLVPQAIHYSTLLRDPTAAEMRAQTYLSIAHGAKGIIYFSYNSLDTSLLTEDGKPNAACEEVGKLAAELQILAPTLLKLKRIKLNSALPEHIDLQGFVDNENKKYIIAVNKDVTATRTVKVRLPANGVKQIVNVLTGKSVAFQKEAGRIRLDLELAPGNGAVLRLN